MDAMLVYQYWVNVFFLFQCCSLRPPRKTLLYIHKVNSKMEKTVARQKNSLQHNKTKIMDVIIFNILLEKLIYCI